MGALSPSSPLILRCIFRRPPPATATHISSIAPSFLKLLKHTPSISTLTPLIPISHTTLSSLISRSLSTSTSPAVVSTGEQTEPDVASEIEVDDREERLEKEEIVVQTEIEHPVEARITSAHKELLSKLKSMSVKEKKELGSYANSLGKKLKSQQLKIHNNCPGELDDVVSQLEEATGSVVVGRIGRTVIIYRPSLTKLKAEEKKKQAMKVFLKRRAAFKSSYQGRPQSRGPSANNRSREYRS